MTVTLSRRNANWTFTLISRHETRDEALMQVHGDATYQVFDNANGIPELVRSRYGGGLETSTDNGATWQRIARPGASKVIGLGINRKALEKGFAANPAARSRDMTEPTNDAISEMARRGAAINAANGK